jgi:hypothetical protein
MDLFPSRNHILPSGPDVMAYGVLPKVSRGKDFGFPSRVIRPISQYGVGAPDRAVGSGGDAER